MLGYLILAVTVFCVALWPAAAGLFWVLGLADSWQQAYRLAAGAVLLLWLLGVIDLVGRKLRGLPLEPKDGEE